MFKEVLEIFEKESPISVMARLILERGITPEWVDEVFAANRQRQYPRELMFSTVVELVTLVSLGLRPSLHAAAKEWGKFPVSLAALYDKIKRTEPNILRALVQGSAQRLEPIVAALPITPSLPGWRLRVLDGNHLPASEKRLLVLREQQGAALPGHTLVVYEPDMGLVTDIVAVEDAHAQERSAMAPLIEKTQAGDLWLADRNFCTGPILQGWHQAGACFIVREHSNHQRLTQEGAWSACAQIETGTVCEQPINPQALQTTWRRVQLTLEKPTDEGDVTIRLWSNLPEEVSAAQIAQLYRKRWRIEGMFQRLESVLQSEIRSLGHPRAALLAFAVAVLAYNVLSILKRYIEQAHNTSESRPLAPPLEVSTYYLALSIRSDYKGMMIVLPPRVWSSWGNIDPPQITQKLLELGRYVLPQRVSTHKRGPKIKKPKNYVDAATARTHHSTARLLKQARNQRP